MAGLPVTCRAGPVGDYAEIDLARHFGLCMYMFVCVGEV